MHLPHALLRCSCVSLLAFAAACGPEVQGYTHTNETWQPGHAYAGQSRAGASAPIPLDKRYDELTPEQKKVVLSDYGNLGPGDEPPFPADGIGSVVRQVTDLQRKRLAQGPTDMVVRVDASGQPTNVAVYANTDEKMTEALAYVLMHTKYKPALCKGNPCQGEYLFSFDFSVR
jgi:hypothetical protein